MPKLWVDEAWDDYLHWLKQDEKTVKKINELIKDIERNGYEGIGKPEPLKHDLAGWWSRKIDEKNRLVYRLIGNDTVEIMQCKGHYKEN